MRRVLVVANRTLGGDSLREVIKARMAAGPCEFTLLVPAGTSRSDAWLGAARQVGSALLPADAAYDQAHQQLDYGLSWMRQRGATVTGDVVAPDVIKGLADVLRRRQFDEIIVSTLPRGVSRWLHQDLPHRVERKFGLPVTVVTAPTSRAH
jgi:hypothetical protein